MSLSRFIPSKTGMRWLFGAIGAGIVATLIGELWVLIKSGTLFDALEAVSGEVEERDFIRPDLVDPTKQAVAQWVLSISTLAGVLLAWLSRRRTEGWLDASILGIGYGFATGIGLLFFLSNFSRFANIHLAIGDAQYAIAGFAILTTLVIAFVQRFSDKD